MSKGQEMTLGSAGGALAEDQQCQWPSASTQGQADGGCRVSVQLLKSRLTVRLFQSNSTCLLKIRCHLVGRDLRSSGFLISRRPRPSRDNVDQHLLDISITRPTSRLSQNDPSNCCFVDDIPLRSSLHLPTPAFHHVPHLPSFRLIPSPPLSASPAR